MKLSVAHAILAATAATTSARLHHSNIDARKLQGDFVCAAIFDPVCALLLDGIPTTYSNECTANNLNATIVHKGECWSCDDEADLSCFPHTEGKPACCSVSNAICGEKPPCQTGEAYCYSVPNFACYVGGHPNCCLDADGMVSPDAALTCNNGEQECDVITTTTAATDVACPLNIATVCGADGVSYDNECLAQAAETTVVSQGKCSDDTSMTVCTMEYAPVCGNDGLTYGNACTAEAAGITVVSEGECKDVTTTPVTSAVAFPCPLIFAPVCGADGVNYDNDCSAVAAGTTVISEGDCPKVCTMEYVPVCSNGVTYGNACMAEAAGAQDISEGECGETVVCTKDNDPVCAFNGVTYESICEAAKAAKFTQGECPPVVCTEEYDPQCGKDGNTYSNVCEAVEAAGVVIAYEGECMACTMEFDPQCGTNGQTYSNKCLAGLEKVEIEYAGECKAVACTMDYTPVCGGDKQTYGNACQAGAANVKVAYEGECMVIACPKNIDPVCSNGKTYDNSCMAVASFLIHKGACKSALEVTTYTESTTTTSATESTTTTSATESATSSPTTTISGVSPDPAPSSASAAVIGTATVLAVSAFIFVAV